MSETKKIKLDLKTVYDIQSPPFEECPFCGAPDYFIKQHYFGDLEMRYNFDGSLDENDDMHEGTLYRDTGKFAYCCNCNKKLFRYRA